MSTTTLPNIRVSSDLTVRVRLKDGGVAIDWSTLNNIKAHIYSDAQRALAGRCDVSVDAEDSTLLVCSYAANKPQYVGINRIVVSAKYMGETKTYDKPAFNFVRWTADQEGEEITIDDPDVDVEIEVEDVTSSILQEAIDAALQAAADAEHAAHLVPLEVLQDCEQATADAIIATAAANAAGIDEVQATVDAQVGTPSVDVDLENKVLSLDFHNMKGETGEAAGFGTASASLTEDGGDPSVTVSASGPDTAKQFAFTFKNLKGDKGDKGDQGNTGSSVEYPYELVNNLTTNDATKGLAASQGVALAGEVSQLEAEVDVLGYGINERIQATPGRSFPISGLVLKAGYKYRVSIRANDSGSFAITLYSNGTTITGFSGTSEESIITPSQDYDNIVVYCGSATTSTDITVAIKRTPSNEELELNAEKLGREVNGVSISQNITATSGETISATIPLSLCAGEKITVKMVGDEVTSITVPVYANVVNSANLLGRLYINGDEAEFTLPVDITELKIYLYSSYVGASGSFVCEVTSKGIYNSRIDKLEEDVEKLSGSEGELDINVTSGTTISTLISHQFNVGDTVTIKATGVTAGTLPLRVYQEAKAPENLIGTVPYDGTEQTMTITREISSLLLYLYSTYVTTSGTLHIEIKFNGEVGTTRNIAEKALAKNVLYEIRFQKENTLFIDNMFRNIVDASRPSNIYFKFDGDLYISNFRTGVARTYTLNDFKALSALQWEDGMDMLVVPQGKRVSYNLETDELYVVQYSYYPVGENELVLLDTFGTIPPGNSWTNNIRGVLVDIWYKVLGTKHEVDLRLQTPNLYWLEAINEWLNDFVSVASPDSLVFSLTSDMHDNCYLARNSNRDNCYPIVNYIHKRAFAPRFHIDLGDIIIQDTFSYDKEHWGLAGARAAMGQFDVKHKFIAIGNHDYNSAPEYVISGQGQTRANMFTDTEVYNSYARSIEQEGVVWGSRRKVYYYKDWEDFKIRMIVLNTQDNELEYDQNDKLLWDPMGKCTFRQEQYEWLVNVALDFSSKGADKSNWQTVVFCHISPAPGYNGNPNSVNANGVELDDNGAVVKVDGVPVPCENGVYKALYAFKNGTLLSYSHLDNWQGGRATIAQRDSQGNPVYDGANLVPVTKDFSTQGAMTLIGVFSGHEHLYKNLDYGGIIFRTFPNGTHAYQAEIPAMGTDNVSVGLFAIDPVARTITIRYIGAHDVEYEGETITIAKDEDLTY